MDLQVIKIIKELEALDLLRDAPKYWWPQSGTFEVLVGAVLTQNTTWGNVEKSLNNLRGYLTLEQFVTLKEDELKEKIRPSGFYNQKAPRLLQIANKVIVEFGDFKTFQQKVSRSWLLEQKGIGKESADAILCYGCFRECFVVDSYTKRVFKRYGIVFKEYDSYKDLVEESVTKHWEIFSQRYESKHHFYARLHGMFVEYNKAFK